MDIPAAFHIHQPATKSLLRFLTCGSVDDGKSTLIGRLLHDTKLIPEDQLSALSVPMPGGPTPRVGHP
jgi:bifunctional enzyme CysN/CysC